MKHLKMIGLAAVAATALMAFVGAGTASATVICKTEPVGGVCPAGWDYPAGTKGVASLESSAGLHSTGGALEATCVGSTVGGTSENTGSATTTVKSTLTSLTWEGCNQTTDTLEPGIGELHWIPGTNNGTLTTFGTKVTVVIAGISCVFGTGNGVDMGTTVGGNPGSLMVNAVVNKVGGSFLCPADSVLQGKYVDTLDNMAYAIATARRAWLTAKDVANTRPWTQFKKLLKQ